jgi:hypothetical protein
LSLGEDGSPPNASGVYRLKEPALLDARVYSGYRLGDPGNVGLRLLRDGAVSRTWIIEDLLASEELHSLERRLRVISGGRVITEPGGSEAAGGGGLRLMSDGSDRPAFPSGD